MEYKELKDRIDILKYFIKKTNKLGDILDTNTIMFGDEMIESYVKLLENILGDSYECISWFIFENNFGRGKLEMENSRGESFKITSLKKLYEFCIEENLFENI